MKEAKNILALSAADRREIDLFVAHNTGFIDMWSMVEAKGGYRPSIDCTDSEREFMADVYDASQAARNDDRRAFRYGSAAIKAKREANPETNREARIAANKTGPAKLSDRIAKAKATAKKSVKAPYKVASAMSISCGDDQGLVGDREYIDRFTLKSLRAFIAQRETSDNWQHQYFVEGEVEGADNFAQYINRFNERSSLCGEWDSECWINAREFWAVEVFPADL